MMLNEKSGTWASVLTHYESYPALEIRDLFKFLFQSAYGCEHLVGSEEHAIARIREEAHTITKKRSAAIEPLDGAYSRVPLSYLQNGLSAETLGKLFCRSAKKEPNGKESLEKKLKILRVMIESGALPCSINEFDAAFSAWQEEGYLALHHSERFRSLYRPAYRVIANEFLPLLPFLSKIDRFSEKETVIVAIEGGSASGKTTLSSLLLSLYDCNVFHMDDFFLRPEQRTRERLSEIGGNVDRERFLTEVLLPLRAGGEICYRKFDCSTQSIRDTVTVPKKRLNIVEGAYSMHPALSSYYDLSVFLSVTPERQRARILQRKSPTHAERFFSEWIPLERTYFEGTNAEKRCTLSISFGN